MKKLFPIVLIAAALIGCNKGAESTATSSTESNQPKTSTESSGEGQLMRINVAKGDTFAYDLNMESGQPQPSKISFNMEMAVTDVKDGKITMVSKILGGTMNGAPIPAAQLEMMKKIVTTSVMDQQGKVLETKTEGTAAPSSGSNNSVPFPDGPVKVGDKWDGETDVNGKKVKAEYTLVAIEEINGKSCAKLEATVNTPDMKLDGPMVYWVELANGMLMKLEFSGEEVTSKSKVKMSMVRK